MSIPEGMEPVVEGRCTVMFKKGEVFYNPVQVLNRDLSILFIKLFSEKRRAEEEEIFRTKKEKIVNSRMAREEYDESHGIHYEKTSREEWSDRRDGIRILEALSASGLRSIRYAQEIPGIKYITCNDIEEAAVESIRRNVQYNGLDTTNFVKPSHADATLLMYQHRSPCHNLYDVVDLDPYGSASIFLDGAVQCISDGGLLAVTCTDMAVLCGNNAEVCFSKYGSTNAKTPFCHEFGLRVVLATIQSHANRYGKYIVPLATFSIDFYCRMFVRVYNSKAEMKKSAAKLSYVIHCLGCSAFHLQPVGRLIAEGKKAAPAIGPVVGGLCEECGYSNSILGPIWTDPMIDEDFLKTALTRVNETPEEEIPTHKRLLGLLTVLSEEVHDAPLYYSLPAMCNLVHCTVPRIKLVQGALVNAGYKVSQSHCDPNAIKTDAPPHVMWDIIRAWVIKHPLKGNRRSKDGGTPGEKILAKLPALEVNWETPGYLFTSRPEVVRYPLNPEKYWGPKARAHGNKKKNVEEEEEEEEHPPPEKKMKL